MSQRSLCNGLSNDDASHAEIPFVFRMAQHFNTNEMAHANEANDD